MTITPLENNWVKFVTPEFSGEAMIFLEASPYGIGGGRISKLFIKSLKTAEVVFNYDRGLDFSTINSTSLIAIISDLSEGA